MRPMKSDIKIKDDIYTYVKSSEIMSTVTGKLCKQGVRPLGSELEDVLINVVSNENGQIQDAIVNISVYVKDDNNNGQNQEATIRLRTLCDVCSRVLNSFYGDQYRSELSKQRVVAVEDIQHHVIVNTIIYKQVNE